MASNEMIEKVRPTSMEPTIRSKRTDRRSLKAQMLVMAIHVFNSQLFRVHAAITKITVNTYSIIHIHTYIYMRTVMMNAESKS